MVKDAASLGFYMSAAGKKFARLQLLTVEACSIRRSAEYPDHEPDFKNGKAEKGRGAAIADLDSGRD